MKRDTLLPEDQLVAVITAIYGDADRENWVTLALADRTRMYSGWVVDSRIGGILTNYMTPEKARSWIKDGPMKEYGRASRGAGRYARFGRQGGTDAAAVVRAALGDRATVVPDSEGVKPLHCLAETPDSGISYVAWGEAHNFRNLLWAALRVSVDEGIAGHMVVTEPPGQVTPSGEIKSHQALAERCDLNVHHMTEVIGARTLDGTRDA